MSDFPESTRPVHDTGAASSGSDERDGLRALPPQEALARLTARRPTWLLEHYGLDPAA